jgi:preprotein translocase subunit YajC
MGRSGILVGIAATVLLAGSAWAWQGPASEPAEETPAAVKSMDTNAEQAPPPTTTTGKGRPGGIFGDQTLMLLLMLGVFFLIWFWMSRGRGKEQKRRAEMLATLKKGDKITTIGGIVGTVIEVKSDEVVVKVDESANVRMKFARWAIRGVGDAAKAEHPEQAQKEVSKE